MEASREAETRLAVKLFDMDNIRKDAAGDAAEDAERKRARVEKAKLLSEKHTLSTQLTACRREMADIARACEASKAECRELKIENARLVFACDLMHHELAAARQSLKTGATSTETSTTSASGRQSSSCSPVDKKTRHN